MIRNTSAAPNASGSKKKNKTVSEKMVRIRTLLDFHFKCDCLACINFKKDKACEQQTDCEVAQTYFKILKELDASLDSLRKKIKSHKTDKKGTYEFYIPKDHAIKYINEVFGE